MQRGLRCPRVELHGGSRLGAGLLVAGAPG